jgi:hypothetical protein
MCEYAGLGERKDKCSAERESRDDSRKGCAKERETIVVRQMGVPVKAGLRRDVVVFVV